MEYDAAAKVATKRFEEPAARFDDMRGNGASFELSGAVDVLRAAKVSEVAAVVAAAERAARGGAWVAGFVTYEAATGLDPTLTVVERTAGDPLGDLPLAWFGVFTRRHRVAAPADPGAYRGGGPWSLDFTRSRYRDEVEAIRRGIARGDYYQVNLTARITGRERDAVARYASLASRQRGEFTALLRTGGHDVLSASPELFFTRNGRVVTTRPMKGTARRGRTAQEDEALRDRLLGSAKERAENVMIVDLMRNDLSRIAQTGSVRVVDLLRPERYPTVWQLTSTVQATARREVGLLELFQALFPSGSVTGAPKAAAMHAIAGVERRPRGVYCGAVGFLRPGKLPAARFSVGIRTLTVSARSGYAEYGTGGGITWSSAPEAEWAELWTKAAVLDGAATMERPSASVR